MEGAARLCPFCGLATCRRMRRDHYLSLFFIPLFPVKRGDEFWACQRCGRLCSGPEAARQYDGARREARPGTCSNCGGPVQPGFVFCPQCGRRL